MIIRLPVYQSPGVHHKVDLAGEVSSVRLVKFLRQADDATYHFL
jgi:hypothetical protein